MSFEDIWNQMEIGPLNYQERMEIRDIGKRNHEASTRSEEDIGSFKRLENEMKYKRSANEREAFTYPYPSSLNTRKEIVFPIERLYKAGVFMRANPLVDCQSASFIIP